MRRFIHRLMFAGTWALFLGSTAFSDGIRDNDAANVRRIPRPGIELSPADRSVLQTGLDKLSHSIEQLENRADPRAAELLPDVVIFYRAVATAVEHGEFFAANEFEKAKRLLSVGQERAEQLLSGEAPWTTQSGLVVRGFVSRIDHTVQPYGLVIPESYGHGADRVRLDIWFHGRGETLSEVNFIDQRMRQPGAYVPANTIVLHPYGRYSNAFKFAGETDVLEALQDTQRRYPIDSHRISVRGFSMGGAACWQFAVHYADRWFAANPGAGFAETPEFLRFFQHETLHPTWYERKLWHLYDCTDYAANLWHCPTIAYSGELDVQKQAADIMAAALKREGIDLVHIIGPQTKHAIHPQAKVDVERRIAVLAEQGRQRVPEHVQLVTYTLKYNRMHWVTVHGLDEHWARATVDADIQPRRIHVRVKNVDDFSLEFGPGDFPMHWAAQPTVVVVDHGGPQCEKVTDVVIESNQLPPVRSDRSWSCRLHRHAGSWQVRSGGDPSVVHKRHGLQGPIDDAFMDSFIIVRPTGRSRHADVDRWVHSELDHAVTHWRRHFRGDARVKDDRSVTQADIATANLVLFGDPASNVLLGRIAEKLPIHWSADAIRVGDASFDAEHHAAILIWPNPLNPTRYIVLNSGFTFREYDYLNNARQVPKLPDWAIVDLRQAADSRSPGRVVAADFFDEHWQLATPRNVDSPAP